MRFLILSSNFHIKNKIGLERMLDYLGWKYEYGKNIQDFDIIYSADLPIDSSKYRNKKFIFGPHFSVFPDNKITKINNIHNNSIYIQPSEWVNNLWKSKKAEKIIPIKTICFPVDTNKFNCANKIRKKVFIYFKRRKPEELQFIEKYLKNNKIDYKIFNYIKKYKEKDYLNYLQKSKYGIILDAHESQGFAIEEALACNVPLLVWNTKYMSQQYGSSYSDIPCTSIPYWDDRCGEFFYEKKEFENKFNIFMNKLETYKPRQYVLDNLSVEKCANKLKNIFNSS